MDAKKFVNELGDNGDTRGQLFARITELSRLNLEAREEWGNLMGIIGDIEQIRYSEGNSVTILCENPDAEEIDKQAAVDVNADFTDWDDARYWGQTWIIALAKAAEASRIFNTDNSND